ncbi:MAG: response regulator [Gammaproteobacteria bacterium]|nr:response regulator [Gammaproteobacteria bacterium]
MSLSKKTLALFLVLGISFCLGSYSVLKLTIFPAFEEFERKSSEEALLRVSRMLESDLHALEIMNMEYSLWDHTYEYVNGRRPEYADENLDPAYWHSVNINLMAIFDAQGNKLYSWIGDPIDGTDLSIQDEILSFFEPGHPLISHQTANDSLKGLISMRSGLMQVVSYPILTSEAEGPIGGSLIVGQHLTPARVHDFGERATAKVSLVQINAVDTPARVSALADELSNSDKPTHIETDDDSVRGYQVLTDITGGPVAILEVSGQRNISQIGAQSIRTTMIALAVASAVFLLAALLFLQRLVTAPLAKLTNQILDIQQSGDLRIDVGTNRTDEVGVLATEFGELTRKLGEVQTDLEAARDEALAMSRAKSDFLARMSHEIRTPMNGVLGMTELLRDTPLDDRQQRFAKTIYESGESLLLIINDILDISKIEAGKIKLDIAPLNLQHMIEECLDLLAESAHSKGLELVCAVAADTNVCVRGDPVRLRQVLMNLIGNAVKFTDKGEVIVRTRAARSSTGAANYRFEVEDTGVGISPENAELIFEPFTQEDDSNTRRYGGTGLGLSISKQLVELMGGEIGVRSTPGRGCTFWFTAELAEDQVPATHPQANLLTGKAAFVVDDNATNQEILRHQLESWGVRVEVAGSGAEALGILKSGAKNGTQFDIMLLDMAMPGMDGLQLAHAIRQEAEYQRTPLVMLSSIPRANIDHEQSTTDPDDWLAKPVRQAQLYDTLLSLLSKTAVDQGVDNTGHTLEEIASNHAGNGLRVLLVDDNEVNLAVAREMLGAMGHQVTVARNGQEAVAAYKDHGFDVVLMDCRMPEMDGFQATQAIRDWEAEHDRNWKPIIALTAHALQGDRQRCLSAGMSDYLSKPYTKQQLSSVISANTRLETSKIVDNDNGVLQLPSAAVAAVRPNAKKRILVVEDNDVNQQVTRAMLKSLGYESTTVSDGDQALDAVARDQFDLILMDCHMPVRSGYDTTKEIRRREQQSSRLRRIPIVALTADFLESNRQKCIHSGMDDYLNKPVTQGQLRVILNRWLADEEAESPAALVLDSDGFSALGDSTVLASIDQHALHEIRQLDASSGAVVLREIVVSYCASSTKLMLQLRSAVADNNSQLVAQLAHSLKGASGQLGATLLASLCADMIVSAAQNDMGKLEAQFERVAVEHCAVLAGLEKALQNMAA